MLPLRCAEAFALWSGKIALRTQSAMSDDSMFIVLHENVIQLKRKRDSCSSFLIKEDMFEFRVRI